MGEDAVEAHVRVGLTVEDVVDLRPKGFCVSGRTKKTTKKIEILGGGVVRVLVIHHVVQVDGGVRSDHAVAVHLSNGLADDLGTVDVRATVLVAELRHLGVVVVVRLHEGANIGVDLLQIGNERVV